MQGVGSKGAFSGLQSKSLKAFQAQFCLYLDLFSRSEVLGRRSAAVLAAASVPSLVLDQRRCCLFSFRCLN